MPIQRDLNKFIEELARAMVDDIVESDAPEEMEELISEIEAEIWRRKLN
jgi:hypothetical protein